MQPYKFRVRYIGEDAAEIRKGEIYHAEDLQDSPNMIGVLDRSGEWYAYPKELFLFVGTTDNPEIIESDNTKATAE